MVLRSARRRCLHLEQDVVVNEFADGEAGAGESNRVVARRRR